LGWHANAKASGSEVEQDPPIGDGVPGAGAPAALGDELPGRKTEENEHEDGRPRRRPGPRQAEIDPQIEEHPIGIPGQPDKREHGAERLDDHQSIAQRCCSRRTPIAATKDHPRRVDYEYERAGTASIFMFCQPLRKKAQH
jgi:hypothetical protein